MAAVAADGAGAWGLSNGSSNGSSNGPFQRLSAARGPPPGRHGSGVHGSGGGGGGGAGGGWGAGSLCLLDDTWANTEHWRACGGTAYSVPHRRGLGRWFDGRLLGSGSPTAGGLKGGAWAQAGGLGGAVGGVGGLGGAGAGGGAAADASAAASVCAAALESSRLERWPEWVGEWERAVARQWAELSFSDGGL